MWVLEKFVVGTCWIYPISKFESHTLAPRSNMGDGGGGGGSGDGSAMDASSDDQPSTSAGAVKSEFKNILFLFNTEE